MEVFSRPALRRESDIGIVSCSGDADLGIHFGHEAFGFGDVWAALKQN